MKKKNSFKVFAIIGLIFIFSISVLYIASAQFINKQFLRIENVDTQNNVDRAVQTLNNDIAELTIPNSDWANWDDSYAFIQNHNTAFANTNIQNSSLSYLGVNYMLFYNRQHQLVAYKGTDNSGKSITVPKEILSYFGPKGKLFDDNDYTTHSGLLNSPTYPVMFSDKPILRSDSSGPSRGTLVFAEILAPSVQQEFAKVAKLNINYYKIGGSLPPDVTRIFSTLNSKTSTVKVLGPNLVAGYRIIDDVLGKPVAVVRVEQPRAEYIEANNSLHIFLVIIAAITLGAISLSFYITNQLYARDQTIKLKNEFFSIASHELRTPLGAIRGNSALLTKFYGPKNDKEFGEMTEDIHESSVRLIRLVTNFLDAARLENSKIPLMRTPVVLSDAITSVIQELQGVAKENGIYIRSQIEGELPRVWADNDRVKQVVYNLIGNAVKFTEKGGITISAKTEGAFVRVYVTDTGRGIPINVQKSLFKKFSQAKASDSLTGSGLGLFISMTLVHLMDGSIGIDESMEGKGTTLAFTLPIATAAQIDDAPESH